jgi:putative peptide zinc metalloprotease protein
MRRNTPIALYSSKNRKDFLVEMTFFSNFTELERQKLANLLEEVEYAPGDIIVQEGEVVEDVFLIVDGQAEVLTYRGEKTKPKRMRKAIPIATLGKYESIGLSETGIYSKSGLRTATVRALTSLFVFKLKIEQFIAFIKKHPHVNTEIKQVYELISRMNFLKALDPFISLPAQKIHDLAEKIKSMHVSAGTIIIKQGTLGDCCYLIRSGKVEVFNVDSEGNEQSITTIEEGNVFGEIALLTSLPRNSSIRALQDCELFAMYRKELFELIESHIEISKHMMALLVERSHPQHSENITVYHQTTADKENIIILKDIQHQRYFRLSSVGWHIWQMLNGKNTLQDIGMSVFEKYNIFSMSAIVDLIASLHRGGFVQLQTGSMFDKENRLHLLPKTRWEAIFLNITKIMEARVNFKNVDGFLTTFYNKGGYVLFTLPIQILFIILCIFGIAAFIQLTAPALVSLKTTPIKVIIINIFIILPIFSVILHEFGHALATKAFGQEVHAFGIGWYWFGPIAFTDTSDMWLSTRGKRIIVNLAGIYVDAIFGGLACIIGYVIVHQHPQLAGILWLFALFNYIDIFKNLSPMLEYDGYYVLSDVLDAPNLRKSAVLWLIETLPHSYNNLSLLRKYWRELTYWIICAIYALISVIITLVLQHYFIRYIFPDAYSSPVWDYFKWVLPMIVIFIASMGIWVQLKNERKGY